nr:hypothetical protein OG461_08695 [Streptomyces sp. NBC_00995]
MLTTSLSVLFVEAVIGTIALFVRGQAQENPGLFPNAMGIMALFVLAPVVAAVGAFVGALVSVCVVMPLLFAAGWLGRGVSGREAWWWVPVVTATASALLSLTATVAAGSRPQEGFGAWLAMTAGLVPVALVARRTLLPDRPRLTVAAMLGRVATYGTPAVVAAGTLAVIALAAGVGHEPPRLSTEQVAGTWSDGKAGVLSLTADGHATATRVDTFDFDDSFEPVRHPCTGTGTWEYDPGTGPQTQTVTVSIDQCPMDVWSVLGTPEHPKLYVFIGDPDSADLYTVRRQE